MLIGRPGRRFSMPVDRSFRVDSMNEIARSGVKEIPQHDLSSQPPQVRLARLSVLVDAFHRNVLEPFELTSSDYDVLSTLRRAGRPYSLSPSQLYGQLHRSSGGMTKILKRLNESGLVGREPDPEDGRSIRVMLTARGVSLHDRVFRAYAAASNRLLAKLTDRQKSEVDLALKLFLDSVEDWGDDGNASASTRR
jgi:DNA-binding MarR family transcriptional regulator